MSAAQLAGLSGWHWLAALALSVAVHGALLIGFRPSATGALPRPAGKPVAVAGTLAGVLGNAKIAGEVQATSAKAVAASTTAEPMRRPTKPTHDSLVPPPVAPTQIEPLRATKAEQPTTSAPTTAPIPPAPVPPAAATVASSAPMAAPPKIQPGPTPAEPPARKSVTEKPPTKPALRKRVTQQKKATPKSSKRTGGRIGTRHQGAGGRQRAGRGGRHSASAGALARYGARVRARILANRVGGGGLRGRAIISFGVSSSGGLRYARISRSSGDGAVDRAALATVRRSSPFTRPPRAATPAQLRFTIPFTFE
jgi:periplasmic protein TonB